MPTFQNLRRCGGNIAAIPGKRFGAARPNVANDLTSGTRLPFRSVGGRLNQTLSGQTLDSTGAVLAGVSVMIFRTENKSFVGETVSDGAGQWTISMNLGGPFFAVSYKAGAPDVAGTTVNTLIPVVT
jgi:hypothetical protein